MLRLLIVTGVCVFILTLARTTAGDTGSSPERCASHPIVNFLCTKDKLDAPQPCAVEQYSNNLTCTYTSVSNDKPFDFTLGMQWLKGFLLTVTEETLGSRDDRLWFSVSSPLTADMNLTFNYECTRARQMAAHTVRLYSLPRRSPHDVPTVFVPESNQHGCTGRFRCFNPLIVANAFDNNSVIVIFTNPPTSFLYENYDVCLKYRFRVKYIQTVKLENANLTKALFRNVLPGTYTAWVQPRLSNKSSCARYDGLVCRLNSCRGTHAVSEVTVSSNYDNIQKKFGTTTRELTERGLMTAIGPVSDRDVESLAVRSRYDQSQNSVPSWQTVVVVSASLVTLVFVAVVAAWKLHQSFTGTTSTAGNASLRYPTQPLSGETTWSVSSVPTRDIVPPSISDDADIELTPSVVANIVNTFNLSYDENA